MSNSILACQNLNKSFIDGRNRIDILKNIELNVGKAEMLAIVGSSGSGKSTLLHLLGGLDKPTSGQVWLEQEDFSSMSEKRRGQMRNQKLGFVYQFHHLLPEFTALENVAMPLLIRGVKVTEARQQAMNLIQRVGLDNRFKHKPGELSGGERQRIAIARALVTQPLCVLADEPTGNLDRKTAQSVYELLAELNAELHISFVLVTHDLQLAAKMHRQVQMIDGVLSALTA